MKKNIQNKIYQGINIKIILFLAIILLAFMLVFTNYISKNFVSEIEKEIKLELKQKVDMAYNVIYPTINSYKKGEITQKEAEEKIKDIVSNMIYGDTNSENYIFMSNYEGYYLVQPFEKEKEGSNMWDYQDSKGNYVIRELVKAAKENPHGSYVRYFNNPPNTEKISEKLSYVRGIPEIQAYIGTGAYLDLKKEELFLLLNKQKNIMIVFTLGITFLMMLYVLKYKVLNNLLVEEIQKRKAVENKLIEEKEREILQKKRLETLFNNSQDAIVEFDREGKILNINKSFKKVFDYSLKEIIGKDIDEIIVPKEEYKEAKKLTDKTLKERVVYIEGIRYKKDKTPVDVLIRSVSIQKEGEVIGGYGIYTDITQIKNYEKKLEYLSIYDVLTGVFNFNYFENKIKEYKEKKPFKLGLIMSDLNGLKFINDTLGHISGDEFLKSFADILKNSVRENDVIARIGGDEFVVILPKVNNREEIKKIMERIKENIQKYNEAIPNKILRLSAALGCSIGTNKEIDKILKEADDAMYRNKLLTKESSKRQLLSVLMSMLSERDFVTSGHTERVADLCKKIAEKIELDEDKKNRLVLLAEVHDLGKIVIPDDILKKPGKLTEEEWEIMKSHTEKGYRIALNSHELSGIADLILKHHERWDGKGYPLGLKEKEIPIECRILSLVDAYDAMMSKRPYNQPKSKEETIEELKRCAGTQFDPYLTEIFLNVLYEEV